MDKSYDNNFPPVYKSMKSHPPDSGRYYTDLLKGIGYFYRYKNACM
jgi:hypothetical protein